MHDCPECDASCRCHPGTIDVRTCTHCEPDDDDDDDSSEIEASQ